MSIKFREVSGFTFDEASHTYQLNGQLLTGATTVLNVRAKDFLKWWTVKLMYETMLPKLADVQGITQGEWDAILTEAKKAHTKVTGQALVSGTIAHDWIEQYIKSKLGTATEIPMPDDEKAVASITQFLEWEKAHHVVWRASEVKLCEEENMIAGTVDAIAEIDGTLTVLDFKTSNQVSEDVALQTAAYLYLVRANVEPSEWPTQRAVLRIPKDGKDFEYQRIDTDYEFDIMTFLRMREIHRWNVYIQNNCTVNNKIQLQKVGT